MLANYYRTFKKDDGNNISLLFCVTKDFYSTEEHVVQSPIVDRQSKCILACLKLDTCRVVSYTWSSGKCDLSRAATRRNENATTNEIEINDVKTFIVCDKDN